ncbi:hypothetical protein B566_EDAN011764 [Ephemera danica]|nr:hypothetical protein B566_EDAN011764 [Ephemera danica]
MLELWLVRLAEQFNLKLLAPRKKVTVLLIGNHSAGKSSFINCLTLSCDLQGNATLHLYPHLKPLSKIPGEIFKSFNYSMVMMQIVQELCKRPGLNRTGFDMPTIFIPDLNKPTKCMNQIDEVCREIERTINKTVQNALNSLGRDCESVLRLAKDRISIDNDACRYNRKATTKGLLFAGVASLLPLLLLLHVGVSFVSEHKLESYLGSSFSSVLMALLLPARVLWSLVPTGSQVATLLVLLASSVVLGIAAKWSLGRRPTLPRRTRQALQDTNSYIETVVRPRKEQLYREYLEQSVADHDL